VLLSLISFSYNQVRVIGSKTVLGSSWSPNFDRDNGVGESEGSTSKNVIIQCVDGARKSFRSSSRRVKKIQDSRKDVFCCRKDMNCRNWHAA